MRVLKLWWKSYIDLLQKGSGEDTVKVRKILVVCLALIGLTACSAGKAQLPEPDKLYEEIRSSVELPAMTDVADYMLEANTGITPEEYDGAVYYIPDEGMAPDQIIIVKAKDEAGAAGIEEKLSAWLTYQEEGSRMYLTEYMPLFQAGVVRRDGQMVSLIVSAQADEIVKVYQQYN